MLCVFYNLICILCGWGYGKLASDGRQPVSIFLYFILLFYISIYILDMIVIDVIFTLCIIYIHCVSSIWTCGKGAVRSC